MNSACDWASSWASAAAYGARRLWSYGRQIDHVAVGHQRAPTGQDRLVGLRLPLHGVEDLDGVDDPLEHLREGPFDQAFQSLLKALQHAHSRPFRCATVPVPLRLAAVLALTRPPRWFLEDMMVSAPRTPVRAPIGAGMLLFPRVSDAAHELRRYPARPTAGSRSILVHATGWSNCPTPELRERHGATWGSGGMADAHGSGPCARKGVRVQLPSSPPAGPHLRVGPHIRVCRDVACRLCAPPHVLVERPSSHKPARMGPGRTATVAPPPVTRHSSP